MKRLPIGKEFSSVSLTVDDAMLDTSVFSGRTIALPTSSDLDVAARLIRQHGGKVHRFGIVAAEGSTGAVERWLVELSERRFDDVVFLTAQSVRLLVEFARQLDREEEVFDALRAVRKLASGPKVLAALEECGLRAELASPLASADSLLDVIKDVRMSGRVIGVASLAPDLRLVQTLESKGASVRVLSGPAESEAEALELIALLLGGSTDAIAFSAPEQIERLCEVARAHANIDGVLSALGRCHTVALNEAVSAALIQLGIPVAAMPSRGLFVRPHVADLAVALGVNSLEAPAVRPSIASGKQRIVVIGNGMVGYKFCERLTEYDSAGKFEIVAFCEEPRPAYDRVQLTSYFEKSSADELLLASIDWYKSRGIRLLIGERALSIDREHKAVRSSSGEWFAYDVAVLCTGSVPFVPPIPGTDKKNVFVYRTIEDLEGIRAAAKKARRAVVLGGGLLGLEAAKAVYDMGLETHVVEFAPRLMPRQLDGGAARLLSRSIAALGVQVHVNRAASRITGGESVDAVEFKEGRALKADLVVIATGIRARDDIARESRLNVGERGGIIVNQHLRTNDANIYALGECALHDGTLYGLVAPGYQMADVLAKRLLGADENFRGTDQSAKLKLLGVDVASFGDPFADANGARTVVYEDLVEGVYKKLLISDDKKRLLGGILVGDASDYARFVQMFRSGAELEGSPEDLIFGARQAGAAPVKMSEQAQVCSCNNVSKADICAAVREGNCKTVADVKTCTKAGTGCGGCIPLVTDLVNAELRANGQIVKINLCEHFAFSRTELYQIIKIKKFKSFEQIVASHGKGHGCEICKPAVASILASLYNDMILEHAPLQDTNDRFLANIQRGGLYSIVPRIPGGEITPEKLIALGEVAKKFSLYTKITGGQRIDLFGAQLNQLPDIWEELVNAGFESGHAYGKAMRTVKSCVGSTWCRYGVQDSVRFSIRVENRYKGIRAPHKLKSAVSGCIRECAEAQSKDFGLIATEKGWNVYVCGNGGSKPRHADLLVADVDEDTALKYLDRFIMFYIRTADRLTRTSVWLDKLEGGLEYLRDVVINDRLGIAAELEQEMAYLVDTYKCEWTEVVKDPVRRAQFRHFANTAEVDSTVEYTEERGQRRPRDWVKATPEPVRARIHLPLLQTSWVKVGNVSDFAPESGSAIKYGSVQIAVYNFASRGEWYACQNMCPHMRDMVLARGLIGDQQGVPKVVCPQHKKAFSLESGECLSGDPYKVRTFPVKVENGGVYLELPSVKEVETLLGKSATNCATDSYAAAE